MLNKRDLLAAAGALLALAALPALAEDAPKKKYLVEIPITFDADGSPVVDLFIGDNGPYRFMIDTGSFGGMIREDLAKKLKLGTDGVISTGALAGRPERSYVYLAHDVLLGGIFQLPRIDLIGLDKLPHAGFDGILPASILTALPTELDFEQAQVRYYLQGAPMDLTGFSKLNAESQADTDGGAEKIYARVRLDGHELLCLVDTGAGGHLLLSGAYVQGHGLWHKNADAGQAGSVGTNGEVLKTRLVKMPDFEFGATHFDDIWVQLGDPGGLDNMLETGIDGIIGCQILRQFTLAFAEHHQVYVKPNGRFSPSAGARPMVGHSLDAKQPVLPFLYRDDRRIVLAAKAGDKPGIGCVINTGVPVSAIAPATAQALELAAVDGGFDGAPLAIDGVWHPPHLVLASRPNLNGRPFAADLGLDFLTAQPSRLDFDTNELTLFLEGMPDLAGYTVFAERKAGPDSRFYITVKLAGVDTLCLIDSFAQPTLTLFPHVVKARNLWDAFPDAEHRKAANGQESRLVKMAGLDAGGLHIATAPVLLADPAMSEPPGLPYDATLGMGFLHRCNWIFTPDGKLYAKPNGFWSG
jgi:hypothetical protein